MDIKTVSPDQVVFWQWGPVSLNATIVFTWVVMGLLVLVSWLVTRRLSSDVQFSRWQNLLEILVEGMQNQIKDITHQETGMYLPFAGTLFLFIGIGFSLYFLLKSHSAYTLWRYYKIHDPSAAEVYGIDVWLFALMAAAALLIPIVVYLMTRRKNKQRNEDIDLTEP